ncbi:alpha/beta hydrolase [Nocardia arizonensis]|uniref:alpha/beta hydrolase n=1 Tax=Nocardia arizonensis TaxID=1141647 RepID=UPI000AA4227F|nr:alpha/beta hydrolase family protein [Nocardia arizonensis]
MVALSIFGACPGTSHADPAVPVPTRAHLIDRAPGPGRELRLTLHSAAMDHEVTVRVLPAADPSAPAPTLYLLNGVDGGADGNWLNRTDVAEFFRDRQVTVVVPFGGAGSYFTDWRADDPVLGRQRWTTFLTRELPPIVDSAFHGNGHNAVVGISMGATAVLQTALAAPGLYRAVGSLSGCARVSDPLGRAVVDAIVAGHGGDPDNMWGDPSDPAWTANDPYVRAENLRGTALYLSAGTGLPGDRDTPGDPTLPDPAAYVDRVALGGGLEAIAAHCTRQFGERLAELGIPATVSLRPAGTHSWPYWEQDLHAAWRLFEPVLDAP